MTTVFAGSVMPGNPGGGEGGAIKIFSKQPQAQYEKSRGRQSRRGKVERGWQFERSVHTSLKAWAFIKGELSMLKAQSKSMPSRRKTVRNKSKPITRQAKSRSVEQETGAFRAQNDPANLPSVNATNAAKAATVPENLPSVSASNGETAAARGYDPEKETRCRAPHCIRKETSWKSGLRLRASGGYVRNEGQKLCLGTDESTVGRDYRSER